MSGIYLNYYYQFIKDEVTKDRIYTKFKFFFFYKSPPRELQIIY